MRKTLHLHLVPRKDQSRRTTHQSEIRELIQVCVTKEVECDWPTILIKLISRLLHYNFLHHYTQHLVSCSALKKTSAGVSRDNPINAEDYTGPIQPPTYWIPQLLLTHAEKDILESTHDWLSDLHINAANQLLKSQFPDQNGLQDTLTLSAMHPYKSSPRDFVQIMNIARNHWVCVANVFSSPGVVEVFDSMPSYSISSSSLKKQVAAVIKTRENSFQIHHVDVQRQLGGSDCGLFAIAFATSLCMRNDPPHQSVRSASYETSPTSMY